VDWRDFKTKTESGWQLYNLSKDIGETTDLAAQHTALVAELSSAWDAWNTHNIAPLWHGSPTEDPTAPAPPAAKKKK
jgi:hypothetical protein